VYSTLCNAHVKMHFSDGSHGVAGRASRSEGYLGEENEPCVPVEAHARYRHDDGNAMAAFAAGANSPGHGSSSHRDAVIETHGREVARVRRVRRWI